jgi:hypothetical protein
VDHQRRQRLALDVLGDDRRAPTAPAQHRQHRLQAESFSLQQHVDVFESAVTFSALVMK